MNCKPCSVSWTAPVNNCPVCGADADLDDQIIHIYPTFGRQHVTDQRDGCWCHPRVELTDGGVLVIHEAEQ